MKKKFNKINEKEAVRIKLEKEKPVIIEDGKGRGILAINLGELSLYEFSTDNVPNIDLFFPKGYFGKVNQRSLNEIGLTIEKISIL